MIVQSGSISGPACTRKLDDTVVQQLLELSDLKNLLENEQVRNVTEDLIHHVMARVHEISKTIRALPSEAIQRYVASRDAVLKSLRDVSIELNLALDQLEMKGKTRSFYKSLLLCQEYLERALEQRIDEKSTWEVDFPSQPSSEAEVRGNVKRPTGNFISQARYYRLDILKALADLRDNCVILDEASYASDGWPYRCLQITNALHALCEPIQELCDLLDSPGYFHIPVSSHYCHLVVELHHSKEQLSKLITLIATQRFHRLSSAKAQKIKHDVHQAIESLLQSSSGIPQSIAGVLDVAQFQERRVSKLCSLSL